METAVAAQLLLAVLMFLQTISYASTLKCYRCSSVPMPGVSARDQIPPCSTFNYSSVYEVECDFSTYCMKKTFELVLSKDKKVEGVERDCAPQKCKSHVYEHKEWRETETIDDSIYQPGCFADDSQEVKTPSTRYCYCRSNLCNSDTSVYNGVSMRNRNILTVLFILVYTRVFTCLCS